MNNILVSTKTKNPINLGDIVTNLRGEKSAVIAYTGPTHRNAEGRIYTEAGEFAPYVYGC